MGKCEGRSGGGGTVREEVYDQVVYGGECRS